MKRALPVLLIGILAAAPVVHAAFYQWTDGDGVVHFTDNPKQIPQKYRKKAKKLRLQEEPSAVKVGQPAAAVPPPPPAPVTPVPPQQQFEAGGHPEQWWRERYTNFKEQIKTVQDRISEKQAKLVELRRKRVIYQRARDREAVNAENADIAADEANLAGLLKRFEDFDAEAAKAGVPAEWRR